MCVSVTVAWACCNPTRGSQMRVKRGIYVHQVEVCLIVFGGGQKLLGSTIL